jgi:membrane dipeptidase
MSAEPEKLLTRVRKSVSPEAVALVDDSIVWDMTLPWGEGYAYYPILTRFQRCGVDVISLTVAGTEVDLSHTVRWLAAAAHKIAQANEHMSLCYSVADIMRAKVEGKLALIFNFQETRPFQKNIELVSMFYRLGVKHALLAYNSKNYVGDGCAERNDGGLSRFGIELVQEMNRVGMLVCGTHSGYRTSMEAMEISTAPCIFSHSNAYAVHPHYRNIRDDQIRACAKGGGVIGVNGLGEFLDDQEARSESVFRHIDYIANLVGPEHVGLGLDYVEDAPGFWRWVEEHPDMWPPNPGQIRTGTKFAQPEQLYELVDLMLRRGYAQSDVRKILGLNFQRVCEQVWK